MYIVFRFSVRGYMRTNVRPSVCDPVRLRLRHLYQVEFCSFIIGYPTGGGGWGWGVSPSVDTFLVFIFFFFCLRLT